MVLGESQNHWTFKRLRLLDEQSESTPLLQRSLEITLHVAEQTKPEAIVHCRGLQ